MPLRPFPLPGLVVERVSTAEPTLLSDAHASTPAASCPDGHTPSARVHSKPRHNYRYVCAELMRLYYIWYLLIYNV